MIIKNEMPPKIVAEGALKYLGITDFKGIIFCYGDTIYNPSNVRIIRELEEHESEHSRQQKEVGGPDIWWGKYFISAEFRLQQEAEAYGRQHAYYKWVNKDRNKRAKHLIELVGYLLSPMYKLNLSQFEAMTIIKKYSEIKHFRFK